MFIELVALVVALMVAFQQRLLALTMQPTLAESP
jgi:hypothetical protein